MNPHPAYLLEPVFQFLDRIIREGGDILYMLLVYASIPLIAWILSGGLRRKQSRQLNHPFIIVIWLPVIPPPLPPPIIGDEPERGRWDCEPPEDDCRRFDN